MKKNKLIILVMFCLFPILLACSALSIFAPTPTTAPGSISGVVSWSTQGSGNKVLVGFTVLIWDSNNPNQFVGKGITNGSGEFEILNLAPGRYIVSGYQDASSVGEVVVLKCWVIKDVEVISGRITQVSLDYNNSLFEEEFSQYPNFCKN